MATNVNGRNCALCRSEMPKTFKPEVDKDLAAKFKKVDPLGYSSQLKKLSDAGLLFADQAEITFTVGNTHELVQNPKPSRDGQT